MTYHHLQVTLSVRAPPITRKQDISRCQSQMRRLWNSLTGSNYRCNSIRRPHKSCHRRSFLWCERDANDNVRSAKCTSYAQACYSSSDNESCAILCNSYFTLEKTGTEKDVWYYTAYQTPNLEYPDAQQIDCFNREILESFPPYRLGCRNSQKQSGRIPSYIIQAVEFVGDVRDSCGNNSLFADCQPLESCPEFSQVILLGRGKPVYCRSAVYSPDS